MSELIARRIDRMVFGGVLLAGVAVLVAGSAARQINDGTGGIDATSIVLFTWPFALIAGRVARTLARGVDRTVAADWMFAASWMVPAAGVALLLPITLHMPFALLIGGRHAFDAWVWLSTWITGLAHVVFAVMCVRRARQLVDGRLAWSAGRIYTATLITSCLPFALLYLIPPALVALTGAACVPLVHGMGRFIARERDEIALAVHPLPRAVARRAA